MTIGSLVETCAQLGIKLSLAGDDDRLKVDAPKGALTATLRDDLTAHKTELIAFLRALKATDEREDEIETETSRPPSVASHTPAPAVRAPYLAEARPLVEEIPLSIPSEQLERTDIEIRKLLSGGDYDASVIDPKDSAARKIVAAQLLNALASRNYDHHEPARRAFMGHGHFDDATKQLRTADSPSERVAAARKLGVVGHSMATAHLVGALSDSAPEVRRASTESLGQIGDPTAVAPLNELLLSETSRQLPEAVIRHAINSIKVTEAKSAPVKTKPALHIVEKAVAKPELEKPKREIFADYLSAFEQQDREKPLSLSLPSPVPAPANNSFESAEERLLREEEALRNAGEALERKRLEVQASRTKSEEQRHLTGTAEAPVEIEIRVHAEEETRARALEAARQKAEEEHRLRSEQEARSRAEEVARLRIEEEAQFRLEAETLRKAAEELARKRAAGEAARKQTELEARRQEEEEVRARVEEEVRTRALDETRRQAQEEMRRRLEEEMALRDAEDARARAVEQARLRAEMEVRIEAELEAARRAEEDVKRRGENDLHRRAEEAGRSRPADESRLMAEVEARIRVEREAARQAAGEEKRRAEEEVRIRAAVEVHHRAEEERLRREAEERHRLEDAQFRVEQETLMQVAAELSRRRTELEMARQNAEEEARLLVEAQQRARVEEERRHQLEVERHRLELETGRRVEEERLAKSRRLAAEEQIQATEQARLHAEEAERRLAELESVKEKALEDARGRAEKERSIKAEILALIRAEEDQRNRIEAEIKRRTEAEARLREQQAQAEEEARVTEEIRLKAEEQARRRAEFEARLREEEALLRAEQETHVKAQEDARRLAAEACLRAEEEARRRAEAETHLKEAEARLQAEQEARVKAEEEATRLSSEVHARTDEESRLSAEAEAGVKEAEARLQVEQEARVRAEAEAERMVAEARSRAEEEARRRAEAEGLAREEAVRAAEQGARQLVEDARVEAEPELETLSLPDPVPAEVKTPEDPLSELSWVDVNVDRNALRGDILLPLEDEATESIAEPSFVVEQVPESAKGLDVVFAEKGIISAEEDAGIPSDILKRLNSADAGEREAGLGEVVRVGGDDAFRCITRAFDDQSADVRNAAARALFALQSDRAATFTRALREGTPERRRHIGQALAGSGLASQAVGNLTGESREKTYDAFSLLFLMAKAGEIKPLMQAIEDYPNSEVRIAVVKLLALSGQAEIVPAFRRLAVRGSLPAEVRSAVMEAIYQISSQARESTPSAA